MKDKLLEQIESLPDELQRRVLDFAQSLVISAPKGMSGKELLRSIGAIPAAELRLMTEAIESGCEKIDWDEW